MFERLKPLLSRKESCAYEGLVYSGLTHDLQIFPKVKMGDVVELRSSGLSDEEFNYATKAHFDFVVADGGFNPVLSIECDFLDKDEKRQQQANLKDWICSTLGLPLIRLDCTEFAGYQISNAMQYIVDDWNAFQRKEHSRLSLTYHGCLRHRNQENCDPEKCSEFREVAQWLFAYHKLTDGVKEMNSLSIRFDTKPPESGYSICEMVLSANSQELLLGRGRCRVSEVLEPIACNISAILATFDASRTIEDVRNHTFSTDDPCVLELLRSFAP